jgi:tether containing UBX domain for GLUT4
LQQREIERIEQEQRHKAILEHQPEVTPQPNYKDNTLSTSLKRIKTEKPTLDSDIPQFLVEAQLRQKEERDLLRKLAEQQEREREREEREKTILSSRDVQVFAPSQISFDISKLEIPDDFYEVNEYDIQQELRIQKEKRRQQQIEESYLMTKEMREKERLKRLAKFTKTLIRIRFPDRVELQATFSPLETTEDLEQFVRQQLKDPTLRFFLYTSPPVVRLSPHKNFREQGFLPAALVYLGLEKGAKATSPFLKEELLTGIKEKLPAPSLFGSAEIKSDGEQTNANVDVNISLATAPEAKTQEPQKNETSESRIISQTQEKAQETKKKLGKGDIPKWFLAGKKK